MATYFLDTSALAKRYVPEQGQGWIMMLCDPAYGHELYICQVALVEVVAALCRRTREQSITLAERDRLIEAFRQDCQNAYNLWPVSTAIFHAAGDLCRSHRLRAYDAVQLACALGLRDWAQARQGPAPIFVCADSTLLTIAEASGLRIENPNSYP
ncbi:MAG: type II toxin-antitoxin system VapC family toxin [Ktedonobacteraceae bacterium]